MQVFNFNPGDQVKYLSKEYIVELAIDLQKVLIVNPIDRTSMEVCIRDLQPINDNKGTFRDLSLITEQEWQIARSREQILKPLMKEAVFITAMAKEVGKNLGLKERQVYNLVKKYRENNYELLSLVPNLRNKKWKGRIKSDLENIINQEIKKLYLNNQRIKSSKVVESIRLNCFKQQLPPPSKNTILRRLAMICTEKELISKRFGAKAAKAKYSAVQGNFPNQEYPLQTYQIDHTVVDLIIVDELYRQPIGRPYITVAIDVFSRCIAGFCLTLDPPSSVSVGLCLVHSILPKEAWLQARKIDGEWPIWGKPERIYVDNGSDFHSAALKRGCAAYGIEIDYRLAGRCHYGGIVERVIGTLMQLVHQLPGTTFSNIKEKGEYQSENKASLTLSELEKWLAIAMVNYYHKKVHSGLKKPPIERYMEGIVGNKSFPARGYPGKIQEEERLLIDFLPIEFRTLQRHGFMLDHIAYYNNSLSPFLANRNRSGKFLIRRDPRDLSKIYVLEPKSQEYFEIPCRTISRASISLWEHREALKYLSKQGSSQVDEESIFRAIEELREISRGAVLKSKAARRHMERQIKGTNLEEEKSKQSKVIEGAVKGEKVIYKGEWW